MDELIWKQDALDVLNEQIEQCNKALGSFDISPKDEYAIKVERASLKAYKEQLENLPIVESKRGYWTESHDHIYMGNVVKEWTNWYCSECDAPNDKPTDFCPNCGADMRTKETDCDYERAVEQLEHDMLYEPTFDPDDGSM